MSSLFCRVFTTIKIRHRKRSNERTRQNRQKFYSSKSNMSQLDWLILQGKRQDGFTVLLMTETKVGIILTLENNTNPFELLGNCRSCRGNWMNRWS